MLKSQLEDSLIDKFFLNRDELIDRYGAGRMSKTEFVEKNYQFMMDLQLPPFTGRLNYHQCLYNYQYYNIMAKYANLQAQDLEFFDPKAAETYKIEEFEYYRYKDEATLSLLQCVDFKNVEAYFMNLSSRRLSGRLFEIVFKDYERTIFHSMNSDILKKLRSNNVFSPVYKDSVIHAYVNSVY